jgi:hypothetical protein
MNSQSNQFLEVNEADADSSRFTHDTAPLPLRAKRGSGLSPSE